MKKVMVFGVFDGIHRGHRDFFEQAKALGDYLIVVVAQDSSVQRLKGHPPKMNLAERLEYLEEEGDVDEVVMGDLKLSSWDVIKKYMPDIIALGYDQKLLREDLNKNLSSLDIKPEIKILDEYEPNKYHSSFLND